MSKVNQSLRQQSAGIALTFEQTMPSTRTSDAYLIPSLFGIDFLFPLSFASPIARHLEKRLVDTEHSRGDIIESSTALLLFPFVLVTVRYCSRFDDNGLRIRGREIRMDCEFLLLSLFIERK